MASPGLIQKRAVGGDIQDTGQVVAQARLPGANVLNRCTGRSACATDRILRVLPGTKPRPPLNPVAEQPRPRAGRPRPRGRAWRHVARCVLLLAAFRLACTAPAGDAGGAVRSESGLLGVVRIQNVTAASRAVETLLRRVNPHTPIENPVRSLLGQLLRNPGLGEIPPDAFLELLLFDPHTFQGGSCVAAFPVTSSLDYRELLSARPGLREEGTVNDITKFVEQQQETDTPLYFSVTAQPVGLFGLNMEAVQRARSLYEGAGPDGLLGARTPTVFLQLYVQRVLRSYEQAIDSGLLRLRDDIVRDRVGEGAGLRHPLGRALDRAFAHLPRLARQVAAFEGAVTLHPDRLAATASLRPVAATQLASVQQAAAQQPPTLAPFLPARCVSFRNLHLWPELWVPFVEASAAVAAAGLDSVIDQAVRNDLAALLHAVVEAGPVETATGTLPPPASQEALGPVRVQLIRWAHPARVDALLERLEALARPESPFQELLIQNQIEWDMDRASFALDGRPVERIRLLLRVAKQPRPEHAVGFVGEPRVYLLGRHEDVFALVTSPSAREAGREAEARALRQEILSQMLTALADEAPALGRNPFYTRIPGRDQPCAALGAVAPLPFLQLAMDADVQWHRTAASTQERINQEAAKKFRTFDSQGHPVTSRLVFERRRMVAELQIPDSALVELARACLGISAGADADR